MKHTYGLNRLAKRTLGIACAAAVAMTPFSALAATQTANEQFVARQNNGFRQGGNFSRGQMPQNGNIPGGQMPQNGNFSRGQMPQGNCGNMPSSGNENFRGGQLPQENTTEGTTLPQGRGFRGGQLPGNAGNQQSGMAEGQTSSTAELASSPSEIVKSQVSGSASSLTADTSSAETITMSSENNEVKIESSGTYIVTGSCSDGNITVKKNTTGVVLILKDLTLTSHTGAPLSLNKYSQVKVIVEGTVSLTDAENAADENSTDADTADAFDGAAIKAKDGSDVCLTGSGTLKLNGSAKNGIKVGGDDNPSFVIDGSLTIDITAANDGINSGYDLSILSGKLNISAADDAIHADRILTIGNEGSGPQINITKSVEGLEGTIVNLFGGNLSLTSSDDGINAANSDGTYSSELTYSINMTAGEYSVNSGGDGLDSNGNINLTGGHMTIKSASNGGEAGIDYDGSCYIADGTLTNSSGISGPDGGMGMGMGGMRMR